MLIWQRYYYSHLNSGYASYSRVWWNENGKIVETDKWTQLTTLANDLDIFHLISSQRLVFEFKQIGVLWRVMLYCLSLRKRRRMLRACGPGKGRKSHLEIMITQNLLFNLATVRWRLRLGKTLWESNIKYYVAGRHSNCLLFSIFSELNCWRYFRRHYNSIICSHTRRSCDSGKNNNVSWQ